MVECCHCQFGSDGKFSDISFFVRKFIRPNIFVIKVLLLVEVNSIHLCNFERSRPVASIKTMEAVAWTKFS